MTWFFTSLANGEKLLDLVQAAGHSLIGEFLRCVDQLVELFLGSVQRRLRPSLNSLRGPLGRLARALSDLLRTALGTLRGALGFGDGVVPVWEVSVWAPAMPPFRLGFHLGFVHTEVCCLVAFLHESGFAGEFGFLGGCLHSCEVLG